MTVGLPSLASVSVAPRAADGAMVAASPGAAVGAAGAAGGATGTPVSTAGEPVGATENSTPNPLFPRVGDGVVTPGGGVTRSLLLLVVGDAMVGEELSLGAGAGATPSDVGLLSQPQITEKSESATETSMPVESMSPVEWVRKPVGAVAWVRKGRSSVCPCIVALGTCTCT